MKKQKAKGRIQFPVVSKGDVVWPKNGHKCPMCDKDMVIGQRIEQVVLTVGALRNVDGQDVWTAVENQHLGGIMYVSTHTHGDNTFPFASVDVVELAANGQADLAFCSPKCLRAFFGKIVDELEKKMVKGK